MNRCSVWALAAGATVLAASASFADIAGNLPMLQDDGARVQLLGRVRAADHDSFLLVVKGMTFRVSAERREVVTREPVREGDRVRVFGDMLGGDRIDASQVQILERARIEEHVEHHGPRVLTGTIRELRGNHMVLSVPAGNLNVDMSEDTTYWRDGKECRLREFRLGDTVRVAGHRDGLNSLTARRVIWGAPVGWSNGAVGQILSLDKRAHELEVDFDGDVWVVKTNAAVLRMDGRKVNLEEMRLDQDIRVFGAGRGAKTVEATNVEVVPARGPEPRIAR